MRTLICGCLLLCAVAMADEKPRNESAIPVELRSCVNIERSSERLACFDRGIAAIVGADGASAPSTESSFGLLASKPYVAPADSGSDSDKLLEALRAKVVSVKTSNGDEVIELDSGQVWRQLSGGPLLLKAGDEVQISRAALGSFQIKVPSGRSGKVKRIK